MTARRTASSSIAIAESSVTLALPLVTPRFPPNQPRYQPVGRVAPSGRIFQFGPARAVLVPSPPPGPATTRRHRATPSPLRPARARTASRRSTATTESTGSPSSGSPGMGSSTITRRNRPATSGDADSTASCTAVVLQERDKRLTLQRVGEQHRVHTVRYIFGSMHGQLERLEPRPWSQRRRRRRPLPPAGASPSRRRHPRGSPGGGGSSRRVLPGVRRVGSRRGVGPQVVEPLPQPGRRRAGSGRPAA